jgi:hypothetical protein
VLSLGKPAFGKVGQLQVIEEQIEELFSGENESERVLSFALAGLSAAAAALFGPRDDIAFNEFFVTRQHVVVGTDWRPMKSGFINTLKRNADFAAFENLGNIATLRGVPYRPLHQGLGTTQKPLPVLEALAVRI